jgi:hypothetical protein
MDEKTAEGELHAILQVKWIYGRKPMLKKRGQASTHLSEKRKTTAKQASPEEIQRKSTCSLNVNFRAQRVQLRLV